MEPRLALTVGEQQLGSGRDAALLWVEISLTVWGGTDTLSPPFLSATVRTEMRSVELGFGCFPATLKIERVERHNVQASDSVTS